MHLERRTVSLGAFALTRTGIVALPPHTFELLFLIRDDTTRTQLLPLPAPCPCPHHTSPN